MRLRSPCTRRRLQDARAAGGVSPRSTPSSLARLSKGAISATSRPKLVTRGQRRQVGLLHVTDRDPKAEPAHWPKAVACRDRVDTLPGLLLQATKRSTNADDMGIGHDSDAVLGL